MAIAIFVGSDEAETKRFNWFINDWKKELLNLDPHLDIRVAPDEIKNPAEIDFILTWRHPLGTLKHFPNLKGIAGLGAGVDHLMSDPELPKQVPVTRLVDPYMINDITQYVLATVLHYVKRMDQWEFNQPLKSWDRQPPFSFSDKTIGIMGLGALGKKAAHALHHIGLNVVGWSNSPKELAGITHYEGQSQFIQFLSETDILV
jgi:glyoxylate/hydroxypyruvate reductase A